MNGDDKFRYSQLKFVVFIGRFQFHRFFFFFFFPAVIFLTSDRTESCEKEVLDPVTAALQKPST